jgi:DNA replication protein DnaC
VLGRFARVDVLILDDWASSRSKMRSAMTCLRSSMIGTGTGRRSTSQLPIDRWHEHLNDPTLADAILDRVVHRAHRVTFTGPSRRKANAHGSSAPTDEA